MTNQNLFNFFAPNEREQEFDHSWQLTEHKINDKSCGDLQKLGRQASKLGTSETITELVLFEHKQDKNIAT